MRHGYRRADLRDDRGGILAARVVARHQDRIGVARSHRCHQRPLAAVALAPAAEYDREAPAARSRDVLQHDQRLFQRVGRVGVVDDHDGLARPAQPLHPARDRLQARERRSRAIEGHAGHEHRRQHAQKIGYVEAPEQGAFDPRLAPGAAHLEGDPLRRHFDRVRLGIALQSRAGGDPREAAVAGAADPAPGERTGEMHPLDIVEIEHRVLQARRFEQALFRACVTLHVAVIVEVVAREIGEKRRPESDAVDASLIQADRSDLHRHALRPLGKEPRERAMQQDGVRGGVDPGIERAREARAERPDHRGLRAAGAARLGDPVAAGGLAVGAGDADHPQPLGGTSVDLVCQTAGEPAQVLDSQVRHPPARIPFEAPAFPEHRGGAALERRRNEFAPVAARARIGEEHFPGGEAAAVRGEARHARPLRCEPAQDVFNLVSHA